MEELTLQPQLEAQAGLREGKGRRVPTRVLFHRPRARTVGLTE